MSSIVHVNETTFEAEVRNSSTPVLVDFYAKWCGPCRMLAPVLDQLAEEFEGRVRVVKVDVDEAPTLARDHGIEAMPTLATFAGGVELNRVVGAPGAAALRETLDELSRVNSPVAVAST